MDRLSDRWMYYCGILAANGIPVDDLKHIQDLIDAEEQNLLVRLPCKVGDKVYRINRYKYAKKPITSMRIVHIRHGELSARGRFGSYLRMDLINEETLAESFCYKCDIGKTVFLTREEAEQALKKMEGGE